MTNSAEYQDMPCGRCDMGIYSEMAMLNRKAREFSVMSTPDRLANMPKCKTHDRICFGAKDFHEAIKQVDGETPIPAATKIYEGL